MQKLFVILFTLLIVSCKERKTTGITAQEIVDKSIIASGGELYKTSNISFAFRDRNYVLENTRQGKILKRIFKNDSITILDIKSPKGFQRFINDSLVIVPDSLANKYSNSINSVHYFAFLPYGLNDMAVNKEFLGEIKIEGTAYYKIKVTFDQEGGGDDFDDIYIYWFNKNTYKPDYLAYEFHVDGGGIRFRKAYNERYVSDIRFVDYINLKPKNKGVSVIKMDSLYMKDQLEVLSKIELKDIEVSLPN